MKRTIGIIIISIMCLLTTQAQTHYVIAFDCTKSMDHPNAFYDNDYSENARDVSKVWEPAKTTVKDIFNSASSNDRFTIILFQDRVLDLVDANKSQLTWSSIDERMEAAIKNPYNTCILSAWERAEKYFSNSNNAVFYLITDGVEDHGTDHGTANAHSVQLCDKIKTFCATYANTDGFYTNLVKSLHDKNNNAFTKALETSPCLRTKIGGRFDDRIVIDIDEDKGNYSQNVSLIFHPTDGVPVNLNNIRIISDNPYFEIIPVSGKIKNNRFDIIIKYKELHFTSFPNGNAYSFPIKVFSDSNEKHQIYDQIINVSANFRRVRVAYLPQLPLEGKSVYQKPFKLLAGVFPKIAAEMKPNVIKFDLNKHVKLEGYPSMFNDEARKVCSDVTLRLKDKKGEALPLVKLTYNGKKCGETFIIRSSDNNAILEIEFDKNTKPKKYGGLYLGIDRLNNIDRINSLSDCYGYKLDLELSFRVKENPWYISALLIFVLLIIFIILWVIIANSPTKKMKGRISSQEARKILRISGKVRAVYTSTPQKQSILSTLFKGKTLFSKPDPFWTSDLIILKDRQRKKSIVILPNSDYEINGRVHKTPYSIKQGQTFQIKNNSSQQIITLKY